MANSKSILIVGGSGFIGSHLALKLREGYNKVFATYFSHPIRIKGVSCVPCDLENRNWIKKLVYMTQPDIVLYLAGKNDLKWAEENDRNSELLHSAGPATIANFTEMMQPKFIFLSNPYVFDGSRGNYHENDTVLPGSTLGRMKLGGENVVRNKCLNYIILRSSPLIGRGNGLNLTGFDHLRMALDRKQRFPASDQEVHSFASIAGFCDVVQKLIDSGVRNRILHYGGLTKITFLEFCQLFAKRFKLEANIVAASRVLNFGKAHGENNTVDFSLNSTQLTELLKIKPLLLEESFDLIEKQLIPHP